VALTPRLRARRARRVALAWVAPALVGVVVLGAASSADAQTGPAPSGSGDPTVTALRQQADAASGTYFAALTRYQTLSAQITALDAQLPQLRSETAARLQAAQGRAVTAYENAGSAQLGVIITSDDALTAARRAQWLSALNARDNHALTELKKTTGLLRDEERDLKTAQTAQASTLQTLDAQGRDIDAKLTAAVSRERQLAAAAATAAAAPAAATSGTGRAAPAAPAASPNYTPAPGQNPHHNDPFLTCVRGRESGGNYSVVNPAGPYLGAYQFLQSTWDSTANHAGRTSLIGVPANQASPNDQDDIAWDLYQWQGGGPWTGDGC
jgi:hypothetical protein